MEDDKNDLKNDEGQKNNNVDEILKGLKLTPEQLEKLKGDSSVLEVITHNLEAKRKANAEAKDYREKFEKLEAEKVKAEQDQLAKKGEFETLYKKAQDELDKTKAQQRDLLIRKEVEVFAIQNGLKKREYLKLFDASSLEVDDSLNVLGIEEKFKEFKDENPELFEGKQPIVPNPKKPSGTNLPDEELKKLENKAKATGNPRDIAAYVLAQKKSAEK
jgi:hypothetical protein